MNYLLTFPLVFLIVNLLTGCTVALVGAGAVGGYLVGEDGRPVASIVDDATITTKIKALFLGDREIDSFKIAVDTSLGVVTLTGRVSNQKKLNHIIELTRTVKGVKQVNSLLSVANGKNTAQ